MRSRKTVSFAVVLCFLPFVLVPVARAARKRQTVIIALDQSGSMVRSDSSKLRVEAAGLLAATQAATDQVGLIGFGGTAQWLQQPVARTQFDFNLLNRVDSSAAHTAFTPVLQAVDAYIAARPSSFFIDNEVSLVLLTDGRSDPAGETVDTDRNAALALAKRDAGRLRVYTIGLGNDVDQSFLADLAKPSRGLFIAAASAADLPDAFLRVAARSASLPVYSRITETGTLQWNGTPQRVLAVFTGTDAGSVRIDGTVLYRSAHVAVAEENPTQHNSQIDWSGKGTVFLCIQEPLILSPQGELPAALLTDAPQSITVTLKNPQSALQDPFFLQNANAYVELSGPDREIVPLYRQGNTAEYKGNLEAQTAGVFLARAYLDSPYGNVETFLGDLTASVVPVGIPQQITAGVFDPLPRSWFTSKFSIQSLLPVGAVHLTFASPNLAKGLPASMMMAPGQQPEIGIVAKGAPGTVQAENYSATWTDGTTQITRTGTLRILTAQMPVAEFVRLKWQWMAGGVLLLFCIVGALWKFWPRPLQADLIVRRNGAQVLRLQLPAQMRTRTLHVAESDNGERSGADRAVIAGAQSRELLYLHSARRRGRWTIVARPRAAHVPAQQLRRFPEIDLRSIHAPVFYTDDGTIQINVLYS